MKILETALFGVVLTISILPDRRGQRRGRVRGLLLQKAQREFQFVPVRLPLNSDAIETPDFLFVRRGRGNFGTRGQFAGFVDDKRTVDHEERLLRNSGRETLRAGRIRAREIESAEHPWQILALDKTINGSPAGTR